MAWTLKLQILVRGGQIQGATPKGNCLVAVTHEIGLLASMHPDQPGMVPV